MSFSQDERDFLQVASISILVPQDTDRLLPEAFDQDDTTVSLADIKQRDVLFFDEHLIVYVVLQVPEGFEKQLKGCLSRLELHVEAWATGETYEVTPRSGTTPNRELLFSDRIKHEDDPIVLVSQNDGDAKISLNLIWRTMIKVRKPRGRLGDARVLVIPSGTVAPVEVSGQAKDYLEPFEPMDHNLFQPLKGARGWEKDVPFLPSSRLRPVAPQPLAEDKRFHIKNEAGKLMRIYPAGITKIRYSRIASQSHSPSLIASLDIELAPFTEVEGSIDRVEMVLAQGRVTTLMENMLPVACQSKDCFTFLCGLEAIGNAYGSQGSAASDTLTISVDVTVRLTEQCKPRISMEWTTIVDFAQAMIRSQSLSTQTAQKSDRLPPLPGGTNTTMVTPFEMTLPPSGTNQVLSISFTAPVGAVKVGIPFEWQIIVVNKTPKTARLAIIPLPRIQRANTQAQQFAKRHAPKASNASLNHSEKGTTAGNNEIDVSVPFIDENVLYAMHHAGAVPPETDLLSLTPELRIGPLGAGQCFEGTITMIAFTVGTFTIDAMRVVNLVKEIEEGSGAAGVITDVHDLPDVVVET